MFQSQDRLFIYIFSTCPFYFFGKKKKKKKKYGKNRKILWYVNHVMRYALTVTYRQALGFRLQASGFRSKCFKNKRFRISAGSINKHLFMGG